MIREEAKQILERISQINGPIYLGNYLEAIDAAIKALSQPSLPSNLDEAAREYGNKEPILPEYYNDGDIPLYVEWTADAFKAGA